MYYSPLGSGWTMEKIQQKKKDRKTNGKEHYKISGFRFYRNRKGPYSRFSENSHIRNNERIYK